MSLKLAVFKNYGDAFEGFGGSGPLTKRIRAAKLYIFLHERHGATNTKLGLRSSKAILQ